MNAMNAMNAATSFGIRALCVASLVIVATAARADDDVVTDEPAPAAAPQPPAGRVIVMPGLRLQIGPGGALQIQGQGQAQFGGAGPRRGQDADAAAQAPYLGVVTGAVPAAVRAQIDLPDGVGVAVEAVAQGSPAEKAGVRRHDVIRAFNDQVVCAPEQLSTLVRLVGAGTKAPLTILRGGREQVLEVTIEEAAAPQAGGAAVGGPLQQVQVVPFDLPGIVAGAGDELPEGVPDEVRRQLEAVLGRVQGMVPGVVPGVAGVQAQVLTIGPNVAAQSMTVVSDARGTIELRESDGKRTVTIKDPSGKEVHAGPLDTDADREAVPEEYRAWVAEVEKRATADRPRVEQPAPDADDPDEAPAAEEPRDVEADT